MRVSKWGNSLAIRLPLAVVDALGLKEGDEITVRVDEQRGFTLDRDRRKAKAIESIRSLRKPLPDGWQFDREEANER